MSDNESLKAFEEDVNEDEELLFSKDAGDFDEEREGQLAIDVYQNENEIVVESPIAAVHSDDLEINITTESVSIKGRRERASKVEENDYFYQECYWGRFSRSVILPQEIDPEKAEASIKNGVLIIRMPKLRKQKQRRLKVKID